MNSYKVETKNAATNGWDAVASIRPDYAASNAKLGWFFKRRVIVLGNPDEAEELAEIKAAALARRLRGEKRIERTAEIDGKKVKTIIWENGRWLIPVGWVKRIKARWSVYSV
jgi:hypothetical protein